MVNGRKVQANKTSLLICPPDAPKPAGNWKDIVWEPNKMYVAKWEDKLTGKIKYVWFSDTAFLKQNREKEKFQKAETLGKQIKQIEAHILKNLNVKDETRRKVATVSWLILVPNMRVGDEKDPDEADTVGAITLRKEHINIVGDTLYFDFLGKDSVRWVKEYKAPPEVIKNIQNTSAKQAKNTSSKASTQNTSAASSPKKCPNSPPKSSEHGDAQKPSEKN